MKLGIEKKTNKAKIKRIRINKTNSEGNNPFLKEEYDGNGFKEGLNLLYNLKGPKECKNLLKQILFILYQLIKYLAFCLLLVESNQRKLQVNFSYILLKTQGTGFVTIFNGENKFLPNEIYINDIKANEIKRQYYFDDSDDIINNFKLIWYNEINSTKNMFYTCNKIIEIDFSNFDTSEVTDMIRMFGECTSLISLNISNFNTSKVKRMGYMFNSCSSLKSLNLSILTHPKLLI